MQHFASLLHNVLLLSSTSNRRRDMLDACIENFIVVATIFERQSDTTHSTAKCQQKTLLCSTNDFLYHMSSSTIVASTEMCSAIAFPDDVLIA